MENNEQMRILQVFAQLNRGGAETMIMNLYRNINRSEIQFDFIVNENESGKEYDFSSEIASLGGKIFFAPDFTIKNIFRYIKWWKFFIKSNPEYKIIHAHHTSPAFIYLRIAKKYGLKTIAHSHIAGKHNNLKDYIKRIFRYFIKNSADYKLACSIAAGRWMFGDKILNNKFFFVFNNAIDTEKFLYNKEIRIKKRNELGIHNEILVGHVGRFNAQKNHKYLLKIFHEYHNINNNSKLLLIGTGEEKNIIDDIIDKLKLKDAVIMTGMRSDVNELLQSMDVFVFPSFYEGLPVTVVEAQAAGLPCLISDKITSEVCISPLVKMLSIDNSVKMWTNELQKLSFSDDERRNSYKYIVDSGYDINNTSDWICEFYKKIGE